MGPPGNNKVFRDILKKRQSVAIDNRKGVEPTSAANKGKGVAIPI